MPNFQLQGSSGRDCLQCIARERIIFNCLDKQHETGDQVPRDTLPQITEAVERHWISRSKPHEMPRRYCNMEYKTSRNQCVLVLECSKWWIWLGKMRFAQRKSITSGGIDICNHSVGNILEVCNGCRKKERRDFQHQNRVRLLCHTSLADVETVVRSTHATKQQSVIGRGKAPCDDDVDIKNMVYCSHYGKFRHSNAKCFQLIGFLEELNIPRKNNAGSNNMVATTIRSQGEEKKVKPDRHPS